MSNSSPKVRWKGSKLSTGLRRKSREEKYESQKGKKNPCMNTSGAYSQSKVGAGAAAKRQERHQQMATVGSSTAPRVTAALLLHIACQNIFTHFKRIRLPRLTSQTSWQNAFIQQKKPGLLITHTHTHIEWTTKQTHGGKKKQNSRHIFGTIPIS